MSNNFYSKEIPFAKAFIDSYMDRNYDILMAREITQYYPHELRPERIYEKYRRYLQQNALKHVCFTVFWYINNITTFNN
jgi:hypothetical protein